MIVGTYGMSDAQIIEEVDKGGRFVIYVYTISIIVMTFKRSSGVRFLKAGESGFLPALPWTLITLMVGWWGIPWGPIYSIQSIYRNAVGGVDVTDQIVQRSA